MKTPKDDRRSNELWEHICAGRKGPRSGYASDEAYSFLALGLLWSKASHSTVIAGIGGIRATTYTLQSNIP